MPKRRDRAVGQEIVQSIAPAIIAEASGTQYFRQVVIT